MTKTLLSGNQLAEERYNKLLNWKYNNATKFKQFITEKSFPASINKMNKTQLDVFMKHVSAQA